MASKSPTAPARGVRIPAVPADQLSAALNWLSLASKGRVTRELIAAVMLHHRRTACDPAILIATTVQYLISSSDREDDWLNRFWHLADQVSARGRARYLNLDEGDLL